MLTDLMGGEMTVASTPGEGSVFRVRLFLPEVHLATAQLAGDRSAAHARRRAAGLRRPAPASVLVVDNEEADRELLVQLLAAAGL